MHRKHNRHHPQLTLVELVGAEPHNASVVVDQNTGKLASSPNLVLVQNSQVELASGLQDYKNIEHRLDRTKLGITVTRRLIVRRTRHLNGVRLILRLVCHVKCFCAVMG